MQKNHLNIIDILLLCYVTIIGCYFYVTPQHETILWEIAKLCTFILCYTIARKITQKQWMLWGIITLGIIEVVICFCQKNHWISHSHSTFNMTGTFSNPGPLGGYLSIAITVVLGLYWEHRESTRLKWILFIAFSLLSFTIIFTESRAGWLSTLIGSISLLFFNRKKEKRSFTFLQKASIGILICLFILSIYYYKKDSADGRVLIWRVSIEMMADAPLAGHGMGTFKNKYMYYQAKYFESHPHSKYNNLADNIAYPYNEFLRIGVELGIIGIILALGIILILLRYTSYQKYNNIYLGAFIALLTFSMFSYPLDILLLWLLIPLLLGGIQHKIVIYIPTKHKIQLIEGIVGIICLITIIKSGHNYYRLEKNVRQLHSSSFQLCKEAEAYINKRSKSLQSTPRLFDIYAQYCYQNLPSFKSLPILKQAAEVIPSTELYCDLGDIYKKQGQIDKALKCYSLAENMTPIRLFPKYKLFCLYRDVGDSIKMYEIGRKTLSTKIKVTNTKALRIKGDIKKTLGLPNLE